MVTTVQGDGQTSTVSELFGVDMAISTVVAAVMRQPKYQGHFLLIRALLEARADGDGEVHTLRRLSLLQLEEFGVEDALERGVADAVEAGIVDVCPDGRVMMSDQLVRHAERCGARDHGNWTKRADFGGEDVPRHREPPMRLIAGSGIRTAWGAALQGA